MENIKEIIDSYLSDLIAPPLVKKALGMEFERYCHSKCFEQVRVCIKDLENQYDCSEDSMKAIREILINGNRATIK